MELPAVFLPMYKECGRWELSLNVKSLSVSVHVIAGIVYELCRMEAYISTSNETRENPFQL